MASFKISNTKKKVSKIKNNPTIILKKHNKVEEVKEYYSYLDTDNKEKKYSGIISYSDGNYYGKVFEKHIVPLIYHESVNSVTGCDEYFSYIDENNEEKIFTGSPKFSFESNSYIGEIENVNIKEEIIDIFKED